MFFSKKGKQEMDNIKEMLEDPGMNMPEIAEEKPVEQEPIAPLFVKVDKYRDIIKTIQEMKLFIAGAKQAFGVLQDIEGLRSDTLNVLRATVQRLERTIIEIDSELLRPQGVSIAEAEKTADVSHIESSLSDLQQQLIELKRELQSMK